MELPPVHGVVCLTNNPASSTIMSTATENRGSCLLCTFSLLRQPPQTLCTGRRSTAARIRQAGPSVGEAARAV